MVNLREKEICEILKQFRERTSILCSTIFTEDGFIVAVEQTQIDEDDDYHQSTMKLTMITINRLEQYVQV